MKITEVKLLVLEDPERKVGAGLAIKPVERLRRIQYTHTGRQGGAQKPLRQSFLEVHTDAGIVGRTDTTMTAYQADIIRYHAVGRDPWEREGMFQQFWKWPCTTVKGMNRRNKGEIYIAPSPRLIGVRSGVVGGGGGVPHTLPGK